MTSGQIDPARLDGEALRRWYLRSPADIERERSAGAARRYESFFGGAGERGQSTSARKGQPDSAEPYGGPRQAHAADDHPYQLAAAPRPGYWLPWGPQGCANCHGYTPETLPPLGGHRPFPPGYSPRTGGSGGSGGQPPRSGGETRSGDHPPQCAIQYENDATLCRQVPNRAGRGRCWESAAKREAYCIGSKGEVGWPSLMTR